MRARAARCVRTARKSIAVWWCVCGGALRKRPRKKARGTICVCGMGPRCPLPAARKSLPLYSGQNARDSASRRMRLRRLWLSLAISLARLLGRSVACPLAGRWYCRGFFSSGDAARVGVLDGRTVRAARAQDPSSGVIIIRSEKRGKERFTWLGAEGGGHTSRAVAGSNSLFATTA